MSFEQKLKMAGKMWGKARERAGSESYGSEVEDGRYVASLSEGEINESKSSGRLQVHWIYTILEGSSQGETLHSYDGLESEDNLVWLARKLQRLGYEPPEDLEDVKDIVEEITKNKPKVQIQVKTKGEFQNIYIDKVLSNSTAKSDGAEAEDDPPETSTAEDVPEDPPVEGDDEITSGMKVEIALSSGTVNGEVLEVLEDEGKVRVETEDGKRYRVTPDKLTKLEEETATTTEEEEEEEEETGEPKVTKRKPKPSPKKKPAPKKKLRRR